MKFTTTLAHILLFATASSAADDYGWQLSGVATDPDVNTGPAVAGTPFQVYLHMSCTYSDGMAAAEFSIAHTYFDAGFAPWSGTLNAGNSTDLLLAVGGCPGQGFVAGVWTFVDFAGLGGTACLVNSPGGVNGTVDCDLLAPLVYTNSIVGFTTDGSAPCETFTGSIPCWIREHPNPTRDTNWGSIKGLYR